MNKVLLWTLSTKCNITCKYCYYKQEGRIGVNKINFGKAFEHIRNLSPDIVYLSGEPTVISGIDQIINDVKLIVPNVKIIFTTNGVLLQMELLNKLLKLVDMFLISLDGHNENMNNIFRSKFTNIIFNIDCLNLKRINSEKKPLLGINCVIHKENVNEIEDIIIYFTEKLKCDYMHFQPIYFEKCNSYSLNKEELIFLSNTIKRIREKSSYPYLSSSIYVEALENYANNGEFGVKCRNGMSVFFLSENQDILSCPSPFMVEDHKCQETLNCINMLELSQSAQIFKNL